MTDTYRSSHRGADKADSYEQDYEQGFLAEFWRNVERPLLMDMLHEIYPEGLGSRDHLDVACGTGRILAAIAPETRTSTGIDISPDMLRHAVRRAPEAIVEVADVTKLELVETVDIVTAFRFFLNAEDELRRDALQTIWNALRPGGFLIANSHASPRSAIGVYRRVSRKLGRTADNTMAHDDFAAMLVDAGFEPAAGRTYGFVPLSTRIPSSLMDRLCVIDRQLIEALPPRSGV
ncbi:MAG: class I SAM-dependent methyltransferase, partial [Acidimicrobiales bacterium]